MARSAIRSKPRTRKPEKKPGTAIARRPSQLPAVQSDRPVTMLDIINRAAFDPMVDADKIERLMEMARRVKADDAKASYISALVIMKPLLPVIDRKGRIIIHEKGTAKTDVNIIQSTAYARWEDIDEAITPILNEHGFVLTHRCGVGAEGRITVTGVLSHKMGHEEQTTMQLPLDTSGSKNNVQAVGSSTSYGKRYTASLLLNLRTKGEDDDGKEGGGDGNVTEEQADRILELLKRDNMSVPKFCQFFKIDNVLGLPAKKYSDAIEVINTRSLEISKAKMAGATS